MRKLLLAVLCVITLWLSVMQAYTVNGYYRSNGTYVSSYQRAMPNAYKYDNYSYKPSQGLYNKSYTAPTKSYSAKWYTPYRY